VPGRLEHLDAHRAEADRVAVLDRAVRVHRAGAVAEHDGRAGALGQLDVTRDEVGVQVRLEHPLDGEAMRLRRIDVLLDVALRIDHGRLAAAADQVRRMGKARQVEGFEHHDGPPCPGSPGRIVRLQSNAPG